MGFASFVLLFQRSRVHREKVNKLNHLLTPLSSWSFPRHLRKISLQGRENAFTSACLVPVPVCIELSLPSFQQCIIVIQIEMHLDARLWINNDRLTLFILDERRAKAAVGHFGSRTMWKNLALTNLYVAWMDPALSLLSNNSSNSNSQHHNNHRHSP